MVERTAAMRASLGKLWLRAVPPAELLDFNEKPLEKFEVPEAGAVIGRGEDADVTVKEPDEYVSRGHLLLRASGVRWTAVDLGSSHGTQLLTAAGNSIDLSPEVPAPLAARDRHWAMSRSRSRAGKAGRPDSEQKNGSKENSCDRHWISSRSSSCGQDASHQDPLSSHRRRSLPPGSTSRKGLCMTTESSWRRSERWPADSTARSCAGTNLLTPWLPSIPTWRHRFARCRRTEESRKKLKGHGAMLAA